MATSDAMQRESEEFNDAFNAQDEAPREVSEDEAFGLAVPGPDELDGIDPATLEVAIETDGGHEMSEEPSDTAPTKGESEAQEQSEGEMVAAPAEEAKDPKDIQREKSWEGRLRAREAELAAREAALKAREETGGHAPSDDGDGNDNESSESDMTEAIEQVSQAVESGEMTPEQAAMALSDDFGEEFSKMISVLVKAEARKVAEELVGEKVSGVSQRVQDLIDDLSDERTKSHFTEIAKAHPDFMDIAESEQMKNYLEGLPEDERAQAQQAIEGGSSSEIIDLLNKVKAQDPSADVEVINEEPQQDNQAQIDAAEGVRSSAIKLPEKPSISGDYESAWNSF